VLFLNWLHTIWKGSIRLTSPMLFSLGMIFVFGLGGLTGIFLGTISTDLYLHDTMFVVGHFHYTMAAASFLASFAGIYFWFPKMFGKQMNETLAKIHFWPSLIGITLLFGRQRLRGQEGRAEPVAGRHARVGAAFAAQVPQLRCGPDGRPRAARIREPRGQEAPGPRLPHADGGAPGRGSDAG
jgi:heme/copper-type cytochrome/quinol oxidase subunit 1